MNFPKTQHKFSKAQIFSLVFLSCSNLRNCETCVRTPTSHKEIPHVPFVRLTRIPLRNIKKLRFSQEEAPPKEKNSSLIEELTNLEEEKSATEKLLADLELKLPEISNDNRKKVFRKTGWKLIASDDVDVRCFIKSAVKEILIGNDEIVLRLNDELSQDAA